VLDAGKREQGRRLRRVNQQIKISVFGPGEEPGGGEAGARGATVHAAVRRAAAMTHTGGTAFAGLGLIVLWSTGLALVLVCLELGFRINLLPTFSKMMIYVCRECGEMAKLSDGPSSQ
jgi:hypothetical protein